MFIGPKNSLRSLLSRFWWVFWWVNGGSILRQQTDVSDPSCLFSALDLAVLTNCSSCAQILLQAGASASQITLDQDSSMENLPVPL